MNVAIRFSVLLIFLWWPVFGPAGEFRAVLPHLTRSDGGFASHLLIDNASNSPGTCEFLPYTADGTALPAVQFSVDGRQTLRISASEAFGSASASHALVSHSTDGLHIVTEVRARADPATPAILPASTKTSRFWRVFCGDWQSVFDGIAVVNMGAHWTAVRVFQFDARGRRLGAQSIVLNLAPKAKALYVIGSPQKQAFENREDSWFLVEADQDLALIALRGAPPGAEPAVLWSNEAIALERSPFAGEPLGIGGGGRMSRVIQSRHDPKTVYAANDMGGVFRTGDEGRHWVYLGRFFSGSSVVDLLEHPVDPMIVYAQTSCGVEKTTNGGATWSLTTALTPPSATTTRPFIANYHGYNEDARRLDILTSDDNAPDTLITAGYLGRHPQTMEEWQSQYIFVSRDAGSTWTTPGKPGQAPFAGLVRTLRIHPDDSTVWYACGHHGCFRSQDQGISWQARNQGLPDEPLPNDRSLQELEAGAPEDHHTGADLYDLLFDPRNPSVMFTLTRTHGVFKSTDGAASWHACNGSGAQAIELYPYEGAYVDQHHRARMETLAMDPTNPDHLVLAQQRRHTLYETFDGGVTWRCIFEMWPASIPLSVEADYPNPPWQRELLPCAFGECGGPTIDLIIDATNPNVFFAAEDWGIEQLLRQHEDAHITERHLRYRGLLTVTSYNAAPTIQSIRSGTKIYAAGMDTGLYRSDDSGQTWTSMVTRDIAWIGDERIWFHGTSLAVADTNPPTLFFACAQGVPGGGLFRSLDDGDSWTRLASGLPDHVVGDQGWTCDQVILASDYLESKTLYAVFTAHGVYRSRDNGDTWQAINTGLPVPDLVVRQGLAVDPGNPDFLVLATWNPGYAAFISRDGGDSWAWQALPAAVDGSAIGGPTIVRTAQGPVIFVSGHRGIVRSTDGGQTWTTSFHLAHVFGDRIGEDWTWQNPLTQVVANPTNANALYFAFSNWGGNPRLPENAVYVSLDCGETWGKLFDLPNFGGNIQVSDDGTHLLQFSGGMDIWRYPLPAHHQDTGADTAGWKVQHSPFVSEQARDAVNRWVGPPRNRLASR